MKTGINASKLAIAAFIIPYIFVLSPVLLMMEGSVVELLFSTVTALAGMIALSSALIGYLAANCLWLERILLVVGGLLMIQPGLLTDAIGLTLFGAVLAYQFKRRKSEAQTV